MSHALVWRFERDTVNQAAVCDDPDCINRYSCPQDCEIMYDLRREEDGSVTHKQWDDDDRPIINRHGMEKVDYCNLVEHLNADPWVLPEMNEPGESFEIGRTLIDPVWQGEDGALWRVSTSQGSGKEEPS